MKFFKKIVTFIGEVKQELKKVTWSTPQELLGATYVIIIITALVAVYIGVIDLMLSRALTVLFT